MLKTWKSTIINFLIKNNSKKNLWFVNIGGYDPFSMQEKHEFGLVIAINKLEAKKELNLNGLLGVKKA